MIWKICCAWAAFVCLGDAVIAIIEFNHLGDMHWSWASNSIIAAGTWIFMGWHNER